MTPVYQRRFPIILAVALVFALTFGAFLPALAQSQNQQCQSPYTVVQGDTLQSIAQRCGVTVDQLVQANPNLSLAVTQQLVIPAGQSGQGTGTQTNTGVTLRGNETLGQLLGRYQLTDQQVHDYLVGNANLSVNPGQTVTFPMGVTVDNAGAQGSTSVQATQTPQATGTAAATVQTTATVGVTPTAQTGSPVGNNFICAAQNAEAGETYVTQADDTLGDLLTMMGVDVLVDSGMSGSTQSSQSAQTTQTPMATQSAAGQATQTPQAGQAGGANQVTNDQVVEFVHLNCDLVFVNGQTAVVPQNANIIIPQTGGGQSFVVPQPQRVEDVPGAAAVYTLGQGEFLSHVAMKFNTTVERLLELNPQITDRARVYSGQQILVPDPSEGRGRQGLIPQTGQAAQTQPAGQVGQVTSTPVATQTVQGTATPLATQTVQSTATVQVTSTPQATETAQVTNTPQVTVTAQETSTPLATASAQATGTTQPTQSGQVTGTPQAGQAGQTTQTPVVVQAGETIGQLAQRLGVTAAQLLQLNPNLVLVEGQNIRVPEQQGQIPQTGSNQTQAGQSYGCGTLNLGMTDEDIRPGYQLYVVQSGDNLYSIARRFNTTPEQLLALNSMITNSAFICRGLHMVVPGPAG